MTTEESVTSSAGTAPRSASRRRAARRAARGPVARVEPGRVADVRHRNPGWLLAGILLVVLSALGGVLLFTARDDRTEALVAARDLPQGAVVGRSDLRIERVAVTGGVGVVAPSAADGLIGQQVVGPVPEGVLLHPEMFSPESPLGPGEMDIGAALDPGEFPQSNIALGATVELLVSADLDPAAPGVSAAPAAPAPAEVTSIGTGTVTAREERASGQLLVTMRVAREVGLVAAQAARDDTLRIALVGGQP